MKANLTESGSTKGSRVLLKDKAYQELKQQILSDRYPPGSSLAERKLAEDLGMSKTPVKAALERLELEGYITIAPQQFVRVRQLEPADIAEQYEVRTAIETYILGRLAGSLSPDQRSRLETNLRKQQELLEDAATFKPDELIARRVTVDAEFHLLLAQIHGNQSLLRIMSELQDRVYRVLTRIFSRNPDRYAESVQEHLKIAQALFEGRGDAAAKYMADHLQHGQSISLL